MRVCVRACGWFLDTVQKGNVGMILYRVMERASDTAAYAPLFLPYTHAHCTSAGLPQKVPAISDESPVSEIGGSRED